MKHLLICFRALSVATLVGIGFIIGLAIGPLVLGISAGIEIVEQFIRKQRDYLKVENDKHI